MNRHASMNRAYRLIWSVVRQVWIPVAEKTRGRGKQAGRTLIAAAMSLGAVVAQAEGPSGGQVVAGSGGITQSGTVTTITQDSPRLSLTWNSFNIAPQQSVDFLQPSSSAIAVNRILDTNGTQILGHLNANGQVFLINPNGILFGPGAEVNVGGLVASTLDLNQASLDTNARSFTGASTASVVNDGTINAAAGGYVALLGSHVSNQGTISARLGTVALGAGSATTLTFNNNSLVHLQVDQSVWRSVAANGGLIRADGGQVIMSAGARDALLASVVNNTGVIEARTVGTHDGKIALLAGMTTGTVDVGGTLDASAPSGGNGGFIETSAAHVDVASDARVTTAAAMGLYGSWLIDPQDYTIAVSGGDITGATLSSELANTPILIESSTGMTAGSGNINVNDAVTWGANTVLTLTASNNVNINANIAATGNTAGLIINPNTANGTETASGTGIYTLLGGASITLSGATPSLSIAGNVYTVINRLGAAGSTTGTDLQGINGGLGSYYALGSNIDATPTLGWNGGAGFMPIGTYGTPFTGTFDGLGHTIGNLTINRPSTYFIGLFGYVASGGVIENVGLLGGTVSGGPNFVGGLAGEDDGTITDSYTSTSITGGPSDAGGLVGVDRGAISQSHATGAVNGGDVIGGLVGFATGTISNSYATGAITGSTYVGGLVGELRFGSGNNLYATGAVSGTQRVGGLIGVNTGSITNSYAVGSVHGGSYVGGLVGNNYGTVSDSYATGSVSGNCVGGLIGFNNGGAIDDTYASGAVSGTGPVGGLVGSGRVASATDSYWNTTTSGQTGSYEGAGLSTIQMQDISNFGGFNFSLTPGATGNNWVMVDADGGLNNAGGVAGATFPMLASEYSTIVTNAHQLQLMAMNVHVDYTLGQDIDASATALAATSGSSDIWSTAGGFVPIGGYHNQVTGSFDGANHTINDLTIDWPAAGYAGLFAVSAAAIQNVGLVGGGMTGTNVGALVGLNSGSITNSYATAIVSGTGKTGGLVGINNGSITNSYTTGNVSGGAYVGGLVGYNNTGTISGDHATGNVSGSSNIGGLVGYTYSGHILTSYASGVITGTTKVGGLVGENAGGAISDSYAGTGSVTATGAFVGGLVGDNGTGSGIDGSYATGVVTGNANVGGLLGGNYGQLTNSYATGAVTGTASSIGGLVGLNSGAQIFSTHATGAVTGGTEVGGLVGSNASGLVAGSYASGNVSGGDRVGGLIGQNYGNISQNPLYGSVSNSYATGIVTATTNAGGLVGLNNAGTINNSYATGSITAGGYAGGLVGTNFGIIVTSYATGTVSAGSGNNAGGLVGRDGGEIIDSYATGTVSGASNVGGLLGEAATQGIESISNSYATGAVSGINNVGGLIGYNAFTVSNGYATGRVSGSANVGGLVGINYGSISNSYATGNVQVSNPTGISGGLVGINNGVISNSYAAGSVSGMSGLVGDNEGAVSDSFWNSDINAIGIGAGTTTGAASLTSAGMMTMSNFIAAGWSIADTEATGSVWRIYEGNTAPLLASFLTPLTVTADNVTQTYGAAPVTALSNVSYSLPGAATSGHLFNLNNPYGGAINVGTYTPSLYSDQQGYDIGYNATLTLTPATLTYNAAAASFGSGQNPTGLSGTLSGFVLTDSQANATAGTLVWTTPASAGSSAGRYAIDGGGLTATNYVFVEATANATALTVQAGSTPVLPLSGADAATLGQAQSTVGTLEADLPASRTNITLALLDLAPDIAEGQGPDSGTAVTSALVSSDGIMMDKRVVPDAMIPSLRIVHGGVKLPDNLVDLNAR